METDPLTLIQGLDFISKCKKEGKKILGVERLFSIGEKFILDPKEIADFTMYPELQRDIEKDADAACEFIKEISTDNSYFLIVVAG